MTFSEDYVKSFSEEIENVNTKKKTSYDLTVSLQLKKYGERLEKFQSPSCKHWRLSIGALKTFVFGVYNKKKTILVTSKI